MIFEMKERIRKGQSWTLVVICVLMQIAMVFPHHHHSDIFCLDHDMAACTEAALCGCEDRALCTHHDDSHMHHSGDADRHSCTSGCVSHFVCGTPHNLHLVPDYSFYTLIYAPDDELWLKERAEMRLFVEEAVFVEHLHARHICRAGGLRAPPSLG